MTEKPPNQAGAAGGGLPRELRPWAGEQGEVRVRIRPSGWAVLFESFVSLVVLALLAGLVAIALAALGWWGRHGGAVLGVLFVLAAVRVIWQGVVVACRRYVVTDQYVLRVAGVFNRWASSLPIERVQHVVVHRSLAERLTGTGTLGFATAGTGGVEVAWVTIARPMERVGQVRGAIEGQQESRGVGGNTDREPPESAAGPGPTASRDHGPVVIGIAGGIAAGKSEVARAFAEAGCVIADSDKAAREALDRPDVRQQLVGWWGESILGPDGRVDRKQVAGVVFSDPAERERLEALVHPIVREGRAALIGRARAAGAPGVVVDAPLLFEAGLDAECDAVVFVDAPRAVRVARVRETRGWDESELARREKVQLPLDAKRDRSDYEVVNDAEPQRLRAEVRRILDQILAKHRGSGTGDPRPDAG